MEHLQQVVRDHARVRAVGAGHSWNKGLFCSGSPDGANVYLAEQDNLKPL